jgi:hypothetical protein
MCASSVAERVLSGCGAEEKHPLDRQVRRPARAIIDAGMDPIKRRRYRQHGVGE